MPNPDRPCCNVETRMYVLIALSATTMRLRELIWIITIQAFSLYTRSKAWVMTRIMPEAQAFLAREYLLRTKVQARTDVDVRASFAEVWTGAPASCVGKPPAPSGGLCRKGKREVARPTMTARP